MGDFGRKAWAATAAVAVTYVIFFLFFDRAVDLWVHRTLAGGIAEEAGSFVSQLATGVYVELALAAGFIWVAVFDPRLERASTKKLFYVLISVGIAILVGEGLKYLLGRYRPVMCFEHGLYGLHFFSSQWELNSTPSGHTLRAFSFFTALSLLYRRFAVLFMLAAVSIGVGRVLVTAHYPSDVLFGAYIGMMSALLVYRGMFMQSKKPLDQTS